MKAILVGSKRFFGGIDGFKSKDTDKIILVDEPKNFKYVRQTSASGSCLFEWKRMTADEFVDFMLASNTPMGIGKFLVKEFNDEIGFTIDHLRKLGSVVDKLDKKHAYEKIIYEAYLKNGKFELTDEQRMEAYKSYKEAREGK